LLKRLAEVGWFTIESRPHGGTVFRLTYAQYDPGVSKPEAWVRLARELIFSGVWAVMPPSARTLYLVLLANSTFGHLADG